jgi:hypothetical protein
VVALTRPLCGIAVAGAITCEVGDGGALRR